MIAPQPLSRSGEKRKRWKALVVGYGNVLRGDDGAGPAVAEVIAAMDLLGVRVIVTQQLTPELAEALSEAEQIVFVDAGAAHPGAEVAVLPVPMNAGAESLGHVSDPGNLLALAGALYGSVPDARLVMIPAVSFEVGAPLSAVAREGCDVAIRQIHARLASAAT